MKKKSIADEHLKDYQKSSYLQRLKWLEDAKNFILKIRGIKRKKIRHTHRR